MHRLSIELSPSIVAGGAGGRVFRQIGRKSLAKDGTVLTESGLGLGRAGWCLRTCHSHPSVFTSTTFT